MQGAVDAAKAGLIAPILVGPAARIPEAAAKASLDIADYPVVEAAFSQESAEKAVAEVTAGHVPAWVIPTNEELMIARHTRHLTHRTG